MGERKPATGPQAETIVYFCEQWHRKYGDKYPFRKVDAIKIAELLKTCDGRTERARAIIDRFFAKSEAFYIGHPVSLMMSAAIFPRLLIDRPAKQSDQQQRMQRIIERRRQQ